MKTAVFWSRVNKTSASGCWLWTAGADANGYGQIRYLGRQEGAHRVAWMLANGPIPRGVSVLHRCDVPRCVNVAHLFLGTQKENVRDCAAKLRHGRAKLSPDDVRAIRTLRADGLSQQAIANEYGIAQTGISNVLLGKTWAHVN